MKTPLKIAIVAIPVVGLLIVGVVLSRNNKTTTTNTTPINHNTNATAQTQDPEDIVAGLYADQIKNTSTLDGLHLLSAKVEDNTDSAGKPVNDRLEIALQNTSSVSMDGFEVYYLITDTMTQAKEGYYKKLTGLTVAAGKTQTMYFDNATGAGHYSYNPSSLYYKSLNKLTFDITVSTSGFKPQTIQATKAAGGAEQKD